jgi:hypothetical protein
LYECLEPKLGLRESEDGHTLGSDVDLKLKAAPSSYIVQSVQSLWRWVDIGEEDAMVVGLPFASASWGSDPFLGGLVSQ